MARRSARCWRPSPRSVAPSTTTTGPSAASITSSRPSRRWRAPGGGASTRRHWHPIVVADDAPVVQVVGRILTQAMRDRASDVHIEPTERGIRVRYRIDGALKEVLTLPASMGVGLISRIKIMAGMNIVERRRPQDGQLRTEIDGKEVDVRVSTVATIWGEKCVMRLLDRTRSVLRLGELGMPADAAETYSELRPCPVRHGAVRRTDRERQDDHALRDPHRDQRQHPQRHDHRGSRRVRLSGDQPDPDQRAGRAHLRHRAFAPSCARTPTSSWSARSATSRRPVSPCSLP